MQDLLVVACGIYFLDQGLNLDPVYWEHRVLAIGPPGKFQVLPSYGDFALLTLIPCGLIYHVTVKGLNCCLVFELVFSFILASIFMNAF